MHTKRIGRWVIVLFLLAALPGMTAVMAQGQEPAAKEQPVVPEPAAITSVSYSYWESEPNNTMGQADVINLGDVVGGNFDPRNSDADYFKFHVDQWGTRILIDADNDSSGADPQVTLYTAGGAQLGFDDDSPYPDALLFKTLAEGWYYLKVNNYVNNLCPVGQCTYLVTVTSPLLVSAAAAGLGTVNVEGISFEARDILAFSFLSDDHLGNAQHRWRMFFDATSAGITKQIVNISTGYANSYGDVVDSSIAVTFATNQTLRNANGGSLVAKPWDWAILYLDEVGPNAHISDAQVLPGSYHGLTTAAEKPDAFVYQDLSPFMGDEHYTWFSTTGAGAVPKAGGGTLKVADEDVFASYYHGALPWVNYADFDGSRFTGMAAEDICAADMTLYDEELYVTILGTGKIMNQSVSQKDIIMFWYGVTNWAWEGLVWHGPDYGWNFNIDAIDWPDQR